MNIKLYQCFHDHGSKPDKKYVSELRPELLCGADIEWRHTDDIQGCLRDNIGDNISAENTQYSELTGYYWIWKNQPDVDVIGIEHYRRHFIKHDAQITNYVHTEDLMTEKEILPLLDKYQFILPVPQSLANTSVYDLYVICFGDQATEIVKWMRNYYTEKGKDNFVNTIYEYMSHNTLYRANMLITTRKEYDEYCKEMFGLLDYMKAHMEVKPDSRVWGYVSELFPAIYVMATEKSFINVDMAVDDFDLDLQESRVFTTIDNQEEDFSQKNPQEQVEFFKTL